MALDRKTGIRISAGLIAGLSLCILWSFLQPLLWASVIAVASWPIYRRFARSMPSGMASNATPFFFTVLVSLLVLGPLLFAFGTLAVQSRGWLETMFGGPNGFVAPAWLSSVPLVGPQLAERLRDQFGAPAGASAWLQRADATAVLGFAQSFGQFAARHLFRIVFAVLLLFFVYRGGEASAQDLQGIIDQTLGDHAKRYIELAIRALRVTVVSTLALGVFDGVLSGISYAIAGVEHAQVWGALTGVLAVIPFLGYAVVAGAALALLGQSPIAASAVFAAGVAILFIGDKIVRPILIGDATRLGFVWVLMGTLGGLELLGLIGIFIGPVVLALAGAVLRDRTRTLDRESTRQA